MKRLLIPLLIIAVLAGCAPEPVEEVYTVTLIVGENAQTLEMEPGDTVNDVLRQADVQLGELDRLNPPSFSPVTDGMTITVVRVEEETVVVEEVVPFERRTVLNESLPAGESRLLQAGENGVDEVTYRITYWNGEEVARNQVRRVTIEPPQDEIVTVGSQEELATITVSGTIMYISGGNAWVVRQNSANRRPLTVDGGLDGRIFDPSADGRRLLFSRQPGEPSGDEEATPDDTLPPFNEVWVILDTLVTDTEPVKLSLENILYAQWVPTTERLIVYATGEPVDEAPGWQANNDLWLGEVTDEGEVINQRQILEASSGGTYGFFGMTFAMSPDGTAIAWAQPDAVGVLDLQGRQIPNPEGLTVTATPDPEGPPWFEQRAPEFERETRIEFAPLNPYDFVWRPDPVWSPDGAIIITATHGPPIGAEPAEDSRVFDLDAFPLAGGYQVQLAGRVGVFPLPQFSPVEPLLAYLQADDPLDPVSRYRLTLMDIDGSNRQPLFPAPDEPGMTAQTFAWSPDGGQIAVVYEGDIFLIDVVTGLSRQLTGDAQSIIPRWTP